MTYTIIDPTSSAYGAVGDGTTDDFPAFKLAIADQRATGNEIRIPPGEFRLHFAQKEVLDFSAVPLKGFRMIGSGIGRTRLILTTEMTSGCLWEWSSGAPGPDWFDVCIEHLSILGSFDGVLHQMGRDDFSDFLNIFTARNVQWINGKVGWNTEALRLNGVYGGHMDSCRAGCWTNGAGANYGKAIHIRQGQFLKHTASSYGNAAYGVYFSGGWSDTNTFDTCDVENVCYGFYNDSANSGLHTVKNSRITYWTNYAVGAPIGRANSSVFKFEGNSLGPYPAHPTFVEPGAVGVSVAA